MHVTRWESNTAGRLVVASGCRCDWFLSRPSLHATVRSVSWVADKLPARGGKAGRTFNVGWKAVNLSRSTAGVGRQLNWCLVAADELGIAEIVASEWAAIVASLLLQLQMVVLMMAGDSVKCRILMMATWNVVSATVTGCKSSSRRPHCTESRPNQSILAVHPGRSTCSVVTQYDRLFDGWTSTPARRAVDGTTYSHIITADSYDSTASRIHTE